MNVIEKSGKLVGNFGLLAASCGKRHVEIDSPEVGRRRQKFHTDPLAILTGFADKNDPAFLLVLSDRVFHDDDVVLIHFVFQVEQATMRADHLAFADFPEFPAGQAAATNVQTHFAE